MKPLAALAKGICLFCAIFAAQAMAFADVAERTAPLPPAEVLIINSFHSGHFWEYNIIKRISEELENTETGFRIRLHCEYLDYERHPPGSLDNELVSLFAQKYAGVSLKAIIVTDNDALDFMLAHGNRLFPGVPVVFCGIADPPAELAERRAHYTGILENFSIHRILESIPLVHPEARHLAIICGDTTSARTALRQAAPELAAMKPGIAVRTLAALPAQAMQKALEELPRDTVLLNFGYYRTADGQSYSMKESLQQLRSWTDLPMYSPWSGQLGKGVLAGQCEFNEFHAVHAARMVLSVLGRHTAPPCDLQDMADQMDIPVEAELLHTAVYIDTIARPSVFLRNLVNNARGYEEFIQWGKNAGFFAVPKQELSLPPKPTSAITFFDPDTVEENSQPTELADVTAEHIFSGITMLHGPKNVGKSHVVLSAANSLITHNSLWGMFPVNGVSTKTLLVDSESTPKNFKDRLGKYELQKQKYNFFSICKLASHQDVNLLDEGFQDTLLEKAKEEGIQTIFFDNLTSLVPDGRVYNASSVNGIFRYLEEMQKCNIVPILVHHSHNCPDNAPEKATMRGTSEFSIRAHTEIVITSPKNKGENSLPSSILDAVNQGDFIVGIHFKVCKAARILEGKTFWLQMPFSATGFKPLTIIDRDGKELPLSFLAGGDSEGSVVPSMGTADELSDEERRVLQKAGSQGKLRNAEVQGLLGCGDSKAGKILAGLVDKGLLKKQGEGRGCHYVITE